MLKESKKKHAVHTTPAKASKLAAPKAGKAPTRADNIVPAEDIMIAAMKRDLPATLFFVAMVDDKTFEQIRRRTVSLALAYARGEAGDEVARRATLTLTNAVALSRRLRH
jgi:hypothetical protein